MEKSSRTVWLFVMLLSWFLLQPGFGGGVTVAAVAADDPYALYCSDDMYFKGDHDLKAQIKIVLQNLLEKTNYAASKESDIRSTFEYPSYDPHVYGSAFCQRSKPEDCAQCLRTAKKMLLRGCYHNSGAEFYSELCFLRFEFYNFIS